MNADIQPKDDHAARELLETLPDIGTVSAQQLVEHVAQRLADHRTRHKFAPGPLALKLDDAYQALIRAGYPDDDLLKRLKVARDFARNLPGKERAA